MPKAEGSAAPPEQEPPTTPDRPPLDWTGRVPATAEPEAEADAAAAVRSDPRPRATLPGADPGHRDAVPLRGTRGLAGWVVFGLGIAAALVAAAIHFRPDPAAPVAEPAPELAASPQPDPGIAAVDPAPAEEAGVVRLRVGPDADPAEVARIADALEAEGVGPIRVETLPFAITQSRVGYYRPDDEAAAGALAELAGPLIGEGEVGLRDYGDLLADTEPGRLDLWLGQ